MPVVVLAASSMGKTGYESRDELNADAELKQRLERLRLAAGVEMGLEIAGVPHKKGGVQAAMEYLAAEARKASGVRRAA